MLQDEARFGTMTSFARAWAEKGKSFIVKSKQGRENFYAYAAVAPASGEAILSKKPDACTESMSAFLGEIADSSPKRPALIFLDRASWHKSKALSVPEQLKLSLPPPYSPELNPAERLWRHIRKEGLHNKVFDTVLDVSEAIDIPLRNLGAKDLMRLCACGYL